MDFVLEGISDTYQGGMVCDLFSGSSSIAGAIGHQVSIHSNDIQTYSGVLADTYLNSYSYKGMPTADQILKAAERIVKKNVISDDLVVDYGNVKSLSDFNKIEQGHQALIKKTFRRDWHLFLKFYSGTWWSAEQCLWIDAIRQIAEEHKNDACYPLIISCLMYAMAYTSQGTGHYAQYRDAKTESSMKDIQIYRRRSVSAYFKKKYESANEYLPTKKTSLKHKISTLDYRTCLAEFSGGTVYADPPYCFVHYSRFYHAIETLVLYDYPAIQVKSGEVVKGRYREDRHQSPFCIKSKVRESFRELFAGVKESDSNLVLSYSNTGMIALDELGELAKQFFSDRRIELLSTDHQHMTLGRQNDRHRNIKECLILVK
ncbi:site-specific DNA-methyltransferase [Janthinobacterium sp. Marseille]|nr:site-specific DNA-methyltransferase [Janthinobacterium sp. Marseille]